MADGNGILRFLTCGSVDDGKSTLIGHLLRLTGNLYEDQLLTLERESRRAGAASQALDYSLLLDGLMAEREQGITIDVAYRYFETPARKFVVADTPGHERYTRNMATGASTCFAAVILLDAGKGVLAQTRRHALICSLMGIRQLLFAVNKMDQVQYDRRLFEAAEAQCAQLAQDLERFGTPVEQYVVVPVSALKGENLTEPSKQMPWYSGTTVLSWLEDLHPLACATQSPLRFPVQYVIKGSFPGEAFQVGAAAPLDTPGLYRAYAGTVVSGRLELGATVAVLPAGVETRVTGIYHGAEPLAEAGCGRSVSLTLEGHHDVARGDLLVPVRERAEVAQVFKTRVVWMDPQPLYAGRSYLFKGACGGDVPVQITRIRGKIELGSYHRLAATQLALNDVGEVELSLAHPIPFDPYGSNRDTGGFILIDRVSNATVACGMILHPMRRGKNLHWHRHDVTREARALLKGQKQCVIWFTGLSGSGKSTIANALELRLQELGKHSMLLDGDNVRQGLNRDLGFTEADRVENIRRIGEVARLMADAGLIVVTAFISPFQAERELVRRLIPEGEFVEVHVATPLEECERRDPKGLYLKARQGLIPNFTGINSPYEPPPAPELQLDTLHASPEACADLIIEFLKEKRLLN